MQSVINKPLNAFKHHYFSNRSAEERRDIALSAIKKTSPVLNSPTKDRARPPGVVSVKTSFRTEQNDTDSSYEQVPEPDYSPPASPVDKRKSQIETQTDQTKSRISVIKIGDYQNANTEGEASESGMYTKVIKANGELVPSTQPSQPVNRRVSGEYTTNIKVAPGAVNVMPKMNEIPKLRKVDSTTKSEETQKSPQSSPRETEGEQNFSVKQIQENIENIYVNENKEKEVDLSPRYKTKVPPPIPPVPKAAAPPPPPTPVPLSPAPPPPPQDYGISRGRLKQVHWDRVPKPLVSVLHVSVVPFSVDFIVDYLKKNLLGKL